MVQGVGFRYTVHRYASYTRLVGWVKNLEDGCVEILVEGPQEDIDSLMKNLETHFGDYIRDKEVQYREPEGHYKDFEIKLY